MSLVSHEASGGNTSWFCSANNTGGSSANLTAIATAVAFQANSPSQLTQQLLRLGRESFFLRRGEVANEQNEQKSCGGCRDRAGGCAT